ncbi:MAG: glycosyltransferase family 9 protein [Candidatus Obscuribacterales bacterium]|nr:glycosyltransferase family 9 protein [Candidatus Obscuribacterales bacterium]
MSWKRDIAEALVWLASRFVPSGTPSAAPESIFVLRNNDLGDLLVITPLFQALHDRYPNAKIVAGVGDWAKPLLELNPYVSEVLPMNAPWHNQVIADQSLNAALTYILTSAEAQRLSDSHFDVAIDVVGSPFGQLLLIKAGIPYRIGVRGFAGGHSGAHSFVNYNHEEHVGRQALRYAEILGATNLPSNYPQVFLSEEEKLAAENTWHKKAVKRIVVGPGGGFATKCWPVENFRQLLEQLDNQSVEIIVVGAEKDVENASALCKDLKNAGNLAGKLSLRQSLALVATSHLVICNSSMLMHAAAAFSIPHVIPLGEYFTDSNQHMSQWGYPDLTHCLGKNAERKTIYNPGEVLAVVNKLL